MKLRGIHYLSQSHFSTICNPFVKARETQIKRISSCKFYGTGAKTPAPVKLPTFSGEQIQKGEVNFDVWSYEVRCLKTQYPESVILQSVRSSLKGTARNMLIPFGETATVDIILQKLDDFYGNVYTAEFLQ